MLEKVCPKCGEPLTLALPGKTPSYYCINEACTVQELFEEDGILYERSDLIRKNGY